MVIKMWYLYRDNQRYGPYNWEQLQMFARNNQILPTDYLFQEGASSFIQASALDGLFARKPAGKNMKRILYSSIAIALFFVLVGSVWLFAYFNRDMNNADSDNLQLGEANLVLKENLAAGESGIMRVESTHSEFNGLSIDIPEDAFPAETSWVIETHDIHSHQFGSDFQPITPLISVKNGGGFAAKPILVHFQIELPDGYFATAFFYDQAKGTLEGIPTVSLTDSELVVATHHFSDLVVSIIEIDKISGNVNIDTGFNPGTDDWQFTNYGSYIAQKGHCAGQAISAMWYYTEKKLIAGERGLYGRYDNNFRGFGTIDFWMDDSLGYRLASATQRDIDWGSKMFLHLRQMAGYNDTMTMLAFAHAMLLTGEPQFVGLGKTGESGGHAIIAHRLDSKGLYVSDPNYPGDERFIPFQNGVLGPYYSGDNAEAIENGNGTSYDKIGWYAKTAMVDWAKVEKRFDELENKNVASDLFEEYALEVRVKEGTTMKWIPLTDDFSITTEQTQAIEYYVGNTRVDMTGKLMVRTNPRYTDMYITPARDTTLLTTVNTPNIYGNIIELNKGANDFGFLITIKVGNIYYYVDFQRFNIIYNEEDEEPAGDIAISGTWKLYAGYDQSGSLVYADSDWSEFSFTFDNDGGFSGIYKENNGYINSSFNGTYDTSDSRLITDDSYEWTYYVTIDANSIQDSGESTYMSRMGSLGQHLILKFSELDGEEVLYDEINSFYFHR